MKYLVSVALCLALLLSAVCVGETPQPDPLESLGAHAYKMGQNMAQLAAAPEYLKFMTGGGGFENELSKIQPHSWDAPESAVLLAVSQENLEAVLKFGARLAGEEIPAIEPWMMDSLSAKMPSMVAGMINGRWGSSWLALASMLSVCDAFALDGLENGAAWVLLYYGDEQPCMLASYAIRDGAVRADAAFIRLPQQISFFGSEIGLGDLIRSLREEDLPLEIPGELYFFGDEAIAGWANLT